MRVIYTDTLTPFVSFDGRQLVLHVDRHGPAVTPSKVPVRAIEEAMQAAAQRRAFEFRRAIEAEIRRHLRDGDPGSTWWIV